MGETRVDLLHLLEDLRDAYPGALEETILTEVVANALDSGARTIRCTVEPAGSRVTVLDDGSGMKRRDLARFHDIAASTKTRGEGIGFAGVGIKLGLLLCDEVVTETRRGRTHVASRWHLASRHKAPWQWIPPAGAVRERGTAVTLHLSNALSPLLDPGFVETAIRRHYGPLLDPRFAGLLAPHYPHGIVFEVNGHRVALERPESEPRLEVAPFEVKLARKRKPSAIGVLVRSPVPLPEAERGVAISTLGKVIKRGWDWLGVTPAAPDRIGGLVEVPALAACLTLNKADFIRSGTRGATYLTYRKGLQEAVSRQLAAWGDAREAAEEARRRAARPVERDLERVLVELAEEFPLLSALVEHHRGGQRKLPMGTGAEARALIAESLTSAEGPDRASAIAPVAPPAAAATAVAEPEPAAAQPQEDGASTLAMPEAAGPRRPARYGLTIQIEARADDPEIARLVESTVWVNESHPAYRRAVASRSEGYHLALAVAMALAPLAVEPAEARSFVTAFLAHWGEALATRSPRRRPGRR